MRVEIFIKELGGLFAEVSPLSPTEKESKVKVDGPRVMHLWAQNFGDRCRSGRVPSWYDNAPTEWWASSDMKECGDVYSSVYISTKVGEVYASVCNLIAILF